MSGLGLVFRVEVTWQDTYQFLNLMAGTSHEIQEIRGGRKGRGSLGRTLFGVVCSADSGSTAVKYPLRSCPLLFGIHVPKPSVNLR